MQGDKNDTAYDRPILSARLTPHRSLGPTGFRVLMTCAVIGSVLISLPFYLMGAWPVVGFFGLDLVGLYVAFRLNYRAARACEEVVLTHLELLVRRVSHWGRRQEWRFNPLWVRLHREEDEDFGLLRLAVVQRERQLDVGGFLSPHERAEFADSLARGLAEARRGPTLG